MRKVAALTLFGVLSVAGCDHSEGHAAAVEARPGGPKFDKAAEDPFAGTRRLAPNGPAAPQARAPAAPPPRAPEAAPAKAPEAPAAPDAAGGDDPLGMRFRDPPWFRKTMFPDATNTDFKRSQADDKGLFSSQILFDLAEGSTVDACVKTLEEAVGKSVTNLETTKTPDRITLKGSTDRYTVTMLCGDVKGVTKAYVSYTWTS